jgi:hypothetical protein
MKTNISRTKSDARNVKTEKEATFIVLGVSGAPERVLERKMSRS